MEIVLIANILIIVLEIMGFSNSFSRGIKVLIFYTQLSNIITMISSVCFIINRYAVFTTILRYLSTVMLTMTVLITVFVLVPSGAGFKNMMLSDNGLFHHTLCPAISITSYILWEQHSRMWGIPVAVTAVYGIVLLYLNYIEKVDGPYPFFRVHNMKAAVTAAWMVALIVLITGLSWGITLIR
ncbi:MAG: hypothetical protein K6E53_08050 [Lachnospiraceae bacterium]|nr:hypothetical protein [Lachnospiraceae bacterium]